ncbi:hypothetical protein KUD11_02370 [Roseovarius sp. LXJ103]|uniref:hypothetical protein n=1 Tax=Roseovarius carneus TaxID=2853164 RepID=UPI0015E80493|nr:hypothetical protein [Roseovarius carneus]MBZ8117485.1 hypothetical protein [Roseovarius carneus]
MTPTQRTLLAILAFVAISLGSFIWYIATWDPAEREPISYLSPPHLLAQNIPEESSNFNRNSTLGAAPHPCPKTQRSA